jgi:hypothetical protein
VTSALSSLSPTSSVRIVRDDDDAVVVRVRIGTDWNILGRVEQRSNAATINTFLAAPREPAIVVRFEEKLMFVMYTATYFGAIAVVVFLLLWPESFQLHVDRRKRVLRFRTLGRPWRRSIITRAHHPADPAALALARDRIEAALAE